MVTTNASSSVSTAQGAEALGILLVDDHPISRIGTRTLILQAHPHAEILEAGTATRAFELLHEREFDLVFLDIKLPEAEGVLESVDTGKRALTRIRDMNGPPVVVMSGETDRALIEDVMGLGAATFVPKSMDGAVAMDAVRRALAGGVWLPSEMIGKGGAAPPPPTSSIRAPLPPPITHVDLGLTVREFEVLRLALNGLTPLKIALTLGINHDNVKKYMSRLYAKYGTANQVSLHAHFAKTGQTLGVLRSSRHPAKEPAQSGD